jgi:pimeloyl-ACP methyl ester carboxylesterase
MTRIRPLLSLALTLALPTALLGQTPDLGLPDLPPLRADSPRDSLLFADRFPVGQDNAAYSSYSATVQAGFIADTETGTGFPEFFHYQIPDSYSPSGPGHPLVVAFHGFGGSSLTPGNQSTLDEECNARGWLFVAPTGIDDKLFGAPISQQNSEAAVQWMLDNYNVDEDRIYVVGFSMGGGIASNFASRRRDPDGLMIAAVGMVSATFDWVMSYNGGFPALHDWFINPYNFGVSPSVNPWPYQQASGAYHVETSYPPYPGTIVPDKSMVLNLVDLPVYITFDTLDGLTEIPLINAKLEQDLSAAGFDVEMSIKTGTVDPDDGITLVPHSWAVLDEIEMFDFFETHSVDRYPEDFEATLDLGGPISWADANQFAPGVFTYVVGEADAGAGTLVLDDVANATAVRIDGAAASLSAMPRVTATSNDVRSFVLTVGDLVQSPSYLKDVSSGLIVPGVASDPSAQTLAVTVPPMGTKDFDVVHDPDWTGVLTTTPNPVAIGASAQIDIDGPAGAFGVWVIVAVEEQLLKVKGVTIGALPVPPAFLFFVPVDAAGDASFPVNVPNDPSFSGLRLPVQAIAVDATHSPLAVTNLWGFEVD